MNNYVNPNYLQENNLNQMPQGFPNQQGVGFPGMPYTGFQTPPYQPPFQQQQPRPPFPVPPGQQPGLLPAFEQSYIENILRLNRGKLATVYMNFENSQWGSKVFKGIVEAAGKDHLILSDPTTGMRYLLLMIYLNYVTFDEEINYDYPFAFNPIQDQLGTAAPIFNLPTQQPLPNQATQFRKKDNKDNSK
jgi:spore germination protein Q